MSLFVHITKKENRSRILRNGIKVGKYSKVVYFMPVLLAYLLTHQWARELKRMGMQNYFAVTFRLQESHPVQLFLNPVVRFT